MIDASIDLKGGGTAALDKRDSGSRLPHFERSEVSRAFVKRASASILKNVCSMFATTLALHHPGGVAMYREMVVQYDWDLPGANQPAAGDGGYLAD